MAEQPARKASRTRVKTVKSDPAPKAKTYRFIDKDPALEFVISKIIESGMKPSAIEAETMKLNRKVSAHCITAWLYGGTKRPQNYTMESVMLAIGFRREWIDIRPSVSPEPPVAPIIEANIQPPQPKAPSRKKTTQVVDPMPVGVKPKAQRKSQRKA